MGAQKAREAKRKGNLVGIFAVQEDDDDEADRERAILAAKRRTSPVQTPMPPQTHKDLNVPGYRSQITDAFCDPMIAKAADPGVIAAHAVRFMKLKRRFRSKEMGGPGRGRRECSRSSSWSRSRSRSRARHHQSR